MRSLQISGIPEFRKDWQTVVPLSKSISNRLLIMSFLSESNQLNGRISEAGDTVELSECLKKIREYEGRGTFIYSGEGGTVLRFLIPLLCITSGEWLLDCSPGMRKRPVKPLIEALVNAGAVLIPHKTNIFPLKIIGKSLNPKEIFIDNSLSSQFMTALLLVAPYFKSDTFIRPLSMNFSTPYITLTIKMMRSAGIEITATNYGYLLKKNKYLIPSSFSVEGDWSSAAFWFALASIRRKGTGTSGILSLPSLQGDSYCVELFTKLGVKHSFDNGRVQIYCSEERQNSVSVDFSKYPDLALPFIIACAANKTTGYFTGLNNLDFKESKRLSAICEAFDLCNIKYSSDKKSEFRLFPSEISDNVHLKSYKDHRLAMSFALLATSGKTFIIDEPECVAKSYPDFWEQLKVAGFNITKVS